MELNDVDDKYIQESLARLGIKPETDQDWLDTIKSRCKDGTLPTLKALDDYLELFLGCKWDEEHRVFKDNHLLKGTELW